MKAGRAAPVPAPSFRAGGVAHCSLEPGGPLQVWTVSPTPPSLARVHVSVCVWVSLYRWSSTLLGVTLVRLLGQESLATALSGLRTALGR